MKLLKNRRKVSNVVVDGPALLRFSVPFFVLLIGALVIIQAMSWKMAGSIARFESSEPNVNAVFLAKLTTEMTTLGMYGIVCLGFATYALWVFYSHAIFGPKVPLERHVGKLIEGDFSSRIHLRRTDEFKKLAADLNRLAEKLEQSRKP
jgi:methyl-accepting chemotaxis protein